MQGKCPFCFNMSECDVRGFFGLLLLIPIGLVRPSWDAIRPKSFFGEVAIQVVATLIFQIPLAKLVRYFSGITNLAWAVSGSGIPSVFIETMTHKGRRLFRYRSGSFLFRLLREFRYCS